MVKFSFRRLSCAILFSCFLFNPAVSSAEAYCSRAARQSRLWTTTSASSSRQQHWQSSTATDPLTTKSQRCVSNQSISTSLRAGAAKMTNASDKFWDKQLVRELFAEMLGTAMIVGLGTGAVMSAIYSGSLVGLFQIASVWIIAVTLAISTTGSISGAHLNPAISVCFAWFRPSSSFGWSKVLPYCIAQLVGSVVASATNFILYAEKIREYESLNAIVRGTTQSIASAKAFGQYFE